MTRLPQPLPTPREISRASDSHLGYVWVVDMMRHACRRGPWAPANVDRHSSASAASAGGADRLIDGCRSLWLARSRLGGLADSTERMERIRQDYVED